MTELTLTRGDTLSVAWTVNTRTQNARTGTYTYTPVTITGSSCRIYFREGSATGTAVIQATSSGGSPQITITGAAIGAVSPTIQFDFEAPLVINPGEYIQVIAKPLVGTATASEVFQWIISPNAYHE